MAYADAGIVQQRPMKSGGMRGHFRDTSPENGGIDADGFEGATGQAEGKGLQAR